MELKLPELSRYRITAITLLVLVVSFLLYMFGFVEKNKSYFENRAFRILGQIEENMVNKYANTLLNARVELAARITQKDTEDNFSIIPDTSGNQHIVGKFNKNLAFIYEKLESSPVYKRTQQLSIVGLSNDLQLEFIDTIHTNNRNIEDTSSIRKKYRIVEFKFRTSLPAFFEPLLTPDIFDQHILFRVDTIRHNSKSTLKCKIVFEDFHSGMIFPIEKDSIFNTVQNVTAGGTKYKLFSHRVSLGPNDNFILCGLVRNNRYQAEVFAMPMFTVMLIILLLGILALGYPFLKLLIMSHWERLRAIDAFFTTSSLVLGSFLLTLLLFSLYGHHYADAKEADDELKKLANDIKKNFEQEVRQAGAQLGSYKKSQIDATLLPEQSDILRQKERPYFPEQYNRLLDVFWVDEEGITTGTWTTEKYVSPYVKVKDREYYAAIVKQRSWRLNRQNSSDSLNFMLTPIFDRTSGRNMAVISIAYGKSHFTPNSHSLRKFPVMALETELRSVINPVLPLGYSFCILDKDGAVWFHSDARKNLQEKFLEECNNNNLLQSVLSGNSSEHLDLSYHGQELRAYVTPIMSMPLYMVVFYDKNYAKTTSVLTVTIAFLSYLIALFPLAVLLIAHKFAYKHDLRILGETSAFRWLRPRDKHLEHYRKMSYGLLLMVVLHVLVLAFLSDLAFIIAFHALTTLYTFGAARLALYNYASLRPNPQTHYRFIIPFGLLVLLINSALFISYPYDRQWGCLVLYQVFIVHIFLLFIYSKDLNWIRKIKETIIYKRLRSWMPIPKLYLYCLVAVLITFGLALVINIAVLARRKQLDQFPYLDLSTCGLITLYVLLVISVQYIISRQNRIYLMSLLKNTLGEYSLPISYVNFLALWVLLISVFPAVSLYRVAYNQEHLIATQHYLLHLAEQTGKRYISLHDKYQALNVVGDNKLMDTLTKPIIYYPASSFRNANSELMTKKALSETKFSARTDAFLNMLRGGLVYNQIAIENQSIDEVPDKRKDADTNALHSHSWPVFRITRQQQCELDYYPYSLIHPTQQYLHLESDTPRFLKRWGREKWPQCLLFLLVWALLLYLLWALVKYAVYRLFNLELYEKYPKYPKRQGSLEDMIKAFQEEKGYSYLFLTGMYYPPSRSFFEKLRNRDTTKEIIVLDFRTFDSRFGKLKSVLGNHIKDKMLIFNYFELLAYWQYVEVLSLLDDLEEMVRNSPPKVKILIISKKNPDDFMRIIDKVFQDGGFQNRSIITARLQILLSQFKHRYYHLNTLSITPAAPDKTGPNSDTSEPPHPASPIEPAPNGPLKFVPEKEYFEWVKNNVEYFTGLHAANKAIQIKGSNENKTN